MKKALLTLILIVILGLAGCTASPATTVLTTQAMPSDTTLAMQRYDANHSRANAFDATFSAIRIDSLKGFVCFKMTLADDDYFDFYYYLVLHDDTRDVNIDQMQLIMPGASTEASYCLEGVTGSSAYAVWVAKDRKSIQFGSVTVYPMAGFDFHIPSMARRGQLGDLSMSTDGTSVVDSQTGRATIKLDVTIEDPEELLTALFIVAKAPDGSYAFETRITITDELLVVDAITLDDLAIGGLTPGVRYEYLVLATGHDGVTPFTDRLIYSGSATVPA